MSTPNTSPTITRWPAARGWLWWIEALRLVREALRAWFWIGAGFIAIFVVPTMLVSMVGSLDARFSFLRYLPGILSPCFTVGFVAAGWSQARGEAPQFSHLFSGFQADVKTLLGIGAVTMALMWLSAQIGILALGGDFAALSSRLESQDPKVVLAALTDSRLWLAGLVYLTLATIVWLAAWLAPMVVVFQHTGVAAAMLGSLKAMLLNWRALAVYALAPLIAVFVISLALGFVMTILALLILGVGGGEGGATLLPLLLWGVMLPFLPLLVSLTALTAFVAYCDIFHAQDKVFPRAPKAPAA